MIHDQALEDTDAKELLSDWKVCNEVTSCVAKILMTQMNLINGLGVRSKQQV